MRVHYIQHVEFETPGIILPWLEKNNFPFTATHAYLSEDFPSVDDFDFLIIMGGPQNANELLAEINFVHEAILAKKIILGICLGSQIIGDALGGKTTKSPHKEIGLYPVQLTDAGLRDPVFKNFPECFPVVHWHNDMPAITCQSVLLAKSAGCPHQAFRYDDGIYGLLFHMEMTSAMIKNMIDHCPQDLTQNKFVQSPEELLSINCSEMNGYLVQLLDYLAKLAKTGKKA